MSKPIHAAASTKQERKSLSIEVKVTSRCSQECIHCVNDDHPNADADIDWNALNRRLEEWARTKENSICSIKEVRMTGGEPLVNFEAVLGIAACCRRFGIPSGINTNGLLFDEAKIEALKKSGLETVKVSFDAITLASSSRIRGALLSLEEFFENIRQLVKSRFKVILRYTLSRVNQEQLQACYNFAQDLGVSQFQIKPLIRAGRAKNLDAFLSPEEVNRTIRRLSQSAAGRGLATEVLCWPRAEGIDFSYKTCGSADKIYISPNLVVMICNYVESGSRPSVGDLNDMPLEAVFRRRLEEEAWLDDIDGHRLVKGCPNAGYFMGRAD